MPRQSHGRDRLRAGSPVTSEFGLMRECFNDRPMRKQLNGMDDIKAADR